MTTSRLRFVFAFGGCLVATLARAQQPTGSPPSIIDVQSGLRLDDAITRAIAQEPLTRAVRADVEVSRGRLQQAGLRLNPTLSWEYRAEPGGTDHLTSAGVEWPLELFRRSARVRTAQQELEAAQLTATDRERLLAAEVRKRYGAAAAAARDVAIAAEASATVERQFVLVRSRVDTGGTPPLERDLIEVELRRLQAREQTAAGAAAVALVQLKQLIGMAPDAPMTLSETIEMLVETQSIVVTPSAVDARSDVRAAAAQIAVAESRVDQARSEGRIDVSVYGSYMWMDAGFPQLGFNAGGALERVRGQFNYVTGGAMLVVPLLNRNQGHVASAEAERTAATARRDAALLAARAEIASATARDQQAQRAVELFASSIRNLARRNLEVVRETYQLGRATVFDVLAEQRRYLDIERDYTDALREAWDARVALKAALGEIK